MSERPTGPRRVGESARQESERPKRFLGLDLWQQIAGGIIAGLAVAAVVALVSHALSSRHRSNQTPSASSSSPAVITPKHLLTTPQSQPSTPRPGSTVWLDQLTQTSGEASSSTVAPGTDGQPLPHELLIPVAQNENAVTYNLNGEYKTLNLEVADAGNASVADGTSFGINLDGKSYPVSPPSITAMFFPIVTGTEDWIINVSGVKSLQLVTQDSQSNSQGPSLLVSGELMS